MANTKFVFLGTEHSIDSEMECYLNINDEIFIIIRENDYPPKFITLDKSTAIQLVKHLKREISKIGGGDE